jgi:GGDEF domain-containing protein
MAIANRRIYKSAQEADRTAMDTSRKGLNWEAVDHLDWHLWIMSVFLICVLGLSLLTFMFPTVFWAGKEAETGLPQRAFIGFCVLMGLALVYLVQRQSTIRRLKRQLLEAHAAVVQAERSSQAQALLSLPNLSQFRDSLAMEFRRAASGNANLAVVVLRLQNLSKEEMGLAAMRLRPTMRRGEMLARMSDCTLGIILPGMALNEANAFATQAEKHLTAEIPEMVMATTVTAFPTEAESLTELENALRNFTVLTAPACDEEAVAV